MEDYSQLLSETISLYNTSEEMFKKTGNLLGKLHTDILKEYQYVARGLIDLLDSKKTATDLEKLCHARHAIKVIINDCVDAIIDNAKVSLKFLKLTYKNFSISEHYNDESHSRNFNEFLDALSSIDKKIESTRQNRTDRDTIYYGIYSSAEFEKVCDFLRYYSALEEKLKEKYLSTVEAAKKNLKVPFYKNVPIMLLVVAVTSCLAVLTGQFLTIYLNWDKF